MRVHTIHAAFNIDVGFCHFARIDLFLGHDDDSIKRLKVEIRPSQPNLVTIADEQIDRLTLAIRHLPADPIRYVIPSSHNA